MRCILLIFLVASFGSSGQTDSIGSNSIEQSTQFKNYNLKNAFFLEAGGNGLFYSFNYERFILRKSFTETSYRIGITPLISLIGLYKGGQLFGMINYSIGRRKYRWETGIGIISHLNFYPEVTRKQYRTGYSYTSNQPFDRPQNPPYIFGITSQLSFRHELISKKMFYRITFTCSELFFRTGKGKLIPWIIPWGGLSLGKRF
ncbi:MAG: hypothetical protein ACKVQB_06760 [Bacteroidia bacterium]